VSLSELVNRLVTGLAKEEVRGTPASLYFGYIGLGEVRRPTGDLTRVCVHPQAEWQQGLVPLFTHNRKVELHRGCEVELRKCTVSVLDVKFADNYTLDTPTST